MSVDSGSTHLPAEPPLSAIPALSRAYICADDAAVYVHEQLSTPRDREYGGFILKSDVGQFFATMPVCGDQYVFDLAQVLTLAENGDFVPPQGYTIEGMYHSHWVTSGMHNESHREHAFRDGFFSVADLSTAIRYRHNYPRFYLSGHRGSLIVYKPSGSDFEKALLPNISRDSRGWPGILEQAHLRGSLLSSQLIALVAASGDLRVVVAGDLWKTRGRLRMGWEDQSANAPSVTEQPVCGPVCDSALEAALYAHARIAGRRDIALAGFILKHRHADQFVCAEPFACDYSTFNRESIFPEDHTLKPALPQGFTVIGVYHSVEPNPGIVPSTGREEYENFFSLNDLEVELGRLLVAPGYTLYLSTRGGALLSFRSGQAEQLRTLLGKLTSSNGQSEIGLAITEGRMTTAQFIDQVAAVGELSVELPGKGWPLAGRVLEG